MPNTFKNYLTNNLTTSDTTIYTGPASTQSTAIGLTIANKHTAQITASIKIQSGATTCFIIKDAPIPVGSSLVAIGGDQKVVVEAGDLLIASCSVASGADSVLSVLEIS